MADSTLQVGDRAIGSAYPVYIVAELSANHNGSYEHALEVVDAASSAGADAVKIQTYTADTLTLDCRSDIFRVDGGTLWDGKYLHKLYHEAHTPWEWHKGLRDYALSLGLDFFSTAFDSTAVAFLEELGVPVHKVASFELVDIPLIEVMARTGKPLILSTGMATLVEIEDAVTAARGAGASDIALLKCTSGYPADPAEMNLRTIPDMAARFRVPVGLSDHTPGYTVPVAAVALGACIIEKHLTISRDEPGPDSAFSMEPAEFADMVKAIRTTEAAMGRVNYGPAPNESKSLAFRRSLFAVSNISAGELITKDNVRSIRPANGLPPKHLAEIVGRRAVVDISRGTPLSWKLIDAKQDTPTNGA